MYAYRELCVFGMSALRELSIGRLEDGRLVMTSFRPTRINIYESKPDCRPGGSKTLKPLG